MKREWSLALVLLLACGPPSASPSDGASDSDSDTTSPDLGSAHDSESTASPEDLGTPESPCNTVEGDHSLACDDGPCPVMTDLEIRCPIDEHFDVGFLNYGGPYVATGDDESWVFAPLVPPLALENTGAYMFELHGGEAELIDTSSIDLNSYGFPLQSLTMGVDAEGVLHMARYDEFFDPPSIVSSVRWEPPTFSEEPVPNTIEHAHGTAFEFDDAGGLHVVNTEGGLQPEHEYVHRPLGGMWTTEAIESFYSESFALTTQGELFHYDSAFDQAIWNVSVVVAGIEQTIATGLPGALRFFAIRKPMPGGAVEFGPDYAGVAATDAGLVFAVGDQLSPTIPATARLDITCPSTQPVPCGQTCDAAGVGRPGDNWAAVRTADGRTWLIWMEHAWDLRFEYVLDFDECIPKLVDDGSIATLRVDEIDLDSPDVLVPKWSLVVRRSNSTGVDQFGPHAAHLHASAWGEAITIAVVEGGTELDPDLTLRVFELDAELLP